MAETYFAYVDPNDNTVRRVIVVASAKLAAELTGTNEADWVQTKQGDPTERYAGKGDVYDARRPEKFEPPTERKG